MTVTGAERTAELVGAAAHPQGPPRRIRADENDIFNGTFLLTFLLPK